MLKDGEDSPLIRKCPEVRDFAVRKLETDPSSHERALEREGRGYLVERDLEISEHELPEPARLQLQRGFVDDKSRQGHRRIESSPE
jgi:hypothetical protein